MDFTDDYKETHMVQNAGEIPDHWLVQYLNNVKKAEHFKSQDEGIYAKENCFAARHLLKMNHTVIMNEAAKRNLTATWKPL